MNKLAIKSRRHFLGRLSTGLGTMALMDLEQRALAADHTKGTQGILDTTHHPAKAKRVIYLFQSGGPSQLDLFDHKPGLGRYLGQDLPDSVRQGQRLTGMTAGQDAFPVAPTGFEFAQHGQAGQWISSALPHLSKVSDEMCLIRSMHTEAINHDPAITFLQTGFQLAGRPSMGSWLSYGLGSANENLPNFVVMVSHRGGQPLYDRLWGSGFLPSRHQGVKFRSKGDPVLYLSDPKGFPREARRRILDDVQALNMEAFNRSAHPEILTRIAQYEMAFRMQSSIPELTDMTGERESTFQLYGEDARKPGTFAHNCLLARRLTERGVRFVQLFHRGWDHHGDLPNNLKTRCQQTDQASAALLIDLKQRGLLDDTLVVWGGEFGRTVYCQGTLTKQNYGRDHHPRCFSMWMAGGGTRPGTVYGKTDDFSYNIAEQPVSVHDLHANILHLLGIDHRRLTFRFQGRRYRLTDIAGEMIPELLA
jgi:hypothetical protein